MAAGGRSGHGPRVRESFDSTVPGRPGTIPVDQCNATSRPAYRTRRAARQAQHAMNSLDPSRTIATETARACSDRRRVYALIESRSDRPASRGRRCVARSRAPLRRRTRRDQCACLGLRWVARLASLRVDDPRARSPSCSRGHAEEASGFAPLRGRPCNTRTRQPETPPCCAAPVVCDTVPSGYFVRPIHDRYACPQSTRRP